MPDPKFGRLITAMVTPFDNDLNLDLNRTEEFVERLIDGGTDSIIVSGTTGESPTISHAEKIELIKTVKKSANNCIPVIANVGNNCTSSTIDFIHEIEGEDIDGLMCVVPYYNKPPQEGLFEHFKAIANSTNLPIILYNIPGRCVINMTADTTIKLSKECENVIAIKEASGDIKQVEEILANVRSDFYVYSGDDSFTMPLMKAGGCGVISTISNVATKEMKDIVEALAIKDYDRASILNENLLPMMNGLFETSNPILVKEALKIAGFNVGGVRLPLVSATEKQHERLKSIMKSVNLL